MTLALFGSRWEQLSGQFLGEGWVVAVTAPSNLPKRLVAGASWTSPGRPRPRATVALALRRSSGAEDVKVKFSADPRLAMPVSPKARCPTRLARRLCT